MNRGSYISIRLHPEISNLTRDKSPIASFIMRVISSAQDHKAFTHPGWRALLHLIGFKQKRSNGIHTDIAINASNGSMRAHHAVLAARSTIFCSMFSHNLKEKQSSTINISDMSIEACQMALVHAADNYDIYDLKEACQESLVEDIEAKNVVERLQNASPYQLAKLKSSCMQYLVNFGKIFDLRDDFSAFLQSADRDLLSEVLTEVLNAWKGF